MFVSLNLSWLMCFEVLGLCFAVSVASAAAPVIKATNAESLHRRTGRGESQHTDRAH